MAKTKSESNEVLNRVVKITKENADIISQGVRPIQDDRVKLTITDENLLIAEADDLGVIVRVVVEANSVELQEGESEFSFFISKKTLSSITDVTKSELGMTTDGQHISFNSDGTVLNMQLTFFDIQIDSTFRDNDKEVIIETKTADNVKDMVNRLSISKATGKMAIPSLKLAQEVCYGNGSNFTIYKKGFSMLECEVSMRFLDFIAAISKFGMNIDFIYDQVDKTLVIRNDKVAYKTKEIEQKFPDINSVLTEPLATVTLSTVGVGLSLSKLSIPLIGMQEQSITLDIDEEKKTEMGVSVTDSSNNKSRDVWAAVKPSGKYSLTVDLNDLKAIASVIDESMELTAYESFTRLSDVSQDTYISNFIQ